LKAAVATTEYCASQHLQNHFWSHGWFYTSY